MALIDYRPKRRPYTSELNDRRERGEAVPLPDDLTTRLRECLAPEVLPEDDAVTAAIGETARQAGTGLAPLDEIARLVRSLTYAEMMELAGGVMASIATPEDAQSEEGFARVLHRWASARGG